MAHRSLQERQDDRCSGSRSARAFPGSGAAGAASASSSGVTQVARSSCWRAGPGSNPAPLCEPRPVGLDDLERSAWATRATARSSADPVAAPGGGALAGQDPLEFHDALGATMPTLIDRRASCRRGQLLGPVDRGLCERLVHEVGDGRAAPEIKCPPGSLGSPRRIARVECLPTPSRGRSRGPARSRPSGPTVDT